MHQVLSMFRKCTRCPCDLHKMHQIPLKTNERHGMPPRDMGGHLKGVMWLGTNIWMPLHSLRGNFGFHEKWTNKCSKAFRGNTNGIKQPRNVTSQVNFPRNVSRENVLKNSQNWRLYVVKIKGDPIRLNFFRTNTTSILFLLQQCVWTQF